MPRIRVRTADGERIVGTPNCSTLTIRLVAHAQRSVLELQADAQLLGDNSVIEHWAWSFPEFSDRAVIELVSEPDVSIGALYDPPDASHLPNVSVVKAEHVRDVAEIEAVEKELGALQEKLAQFDSTGNHLGTGTPPGYTPGSVHCSFCGKSQDEVQKLVAGPAVYICDGCIKAAQEITDE